MNLLQAKTAFVTGGASGIGRASALLFAAEGASVVALDRAPEVEATVKAVRAAGGRALALVKDSSVEEHVASAIAAAIALATCSSTEESLTSASARPPAARTALTVASTSGARSNATTDAPSAANSSALARPIPLAPPVTKAVLACNRFMRYTGVVGNEPTRAVLLPRWPRVDPPPSHRHPVSPRRRVSPRHRLSRLSYDEAM